MFLSDFQCDDCGREFEELLETRDARARCPACASTSTTRQLSAFAIGHGGRSSAPIENDCAGGACFTGGCAGGACGLPS